MKHTLISVCALTAFLSSCGFSEEKCEQADWKAVGQADGARGVSVDRLQGHIKSCAKHGVEIDQSQWRIGHVEGLKTYCTPQSAYINGRNGRSLKNVCPEADVAVLRSANAKGRQYFEITNEIKELIEDRADAKAELRSISDLPDESADVRLLQLEISRINRKIRRLERQRRAFEQL